MMGRADLHIHTDYSLDGLSPVSEILTAAEDAGLQVIAITDHDRIDGALEAKRLARGVEVIVGEEISSRAGHVIGLFLRERIRPGLSLERTIRAIHAQGGISVIAHPLWRLYLGVAVPGRKLGVGFGGVSRSSMRRILEKDPLARPDAVEVWNASLNGRIPHRDVVRLNSESWKLPEVGGSDAHHASLVAGAVTHFPGRTAEDLRRALLAGETEASGSFLSGAETLRLVGGTLRKGAKGVRSSLRTKHSPR